MKHTPYISPHSYNDYYLHQVGRGVPVFSGGVVQRGYGIGGLLARGFRAALPLLKPLIKRGGQTLMKKAFKAGSKEAVQHALGAGVDFAADAIQKRLSKGSNKKKNRKRHVTVKKQRHQASKRRTHKKKQRASSVTIRPKARLSSRTPDIFDE